jgi:N-acylneuraminate cytidylyltransferase/CMP-N,N'-diacetyllegionaminic acid synthase
MPSTLIIIPARSGSKGLTDKNIRLLGGKPLLAWTADAIIQAELADCLAVLSTDAEAYAEIGRQAGLAVPFLRPADCAGDSATALQVIEHALNWFQSAHGYLPMQTMWLQPTSPFRSPAIIRQALGMMAEQSVEAVIGCKEIHRDLTTLFRCRDGFLSPLDQDKPTQTSRQQIKALLTPNGAMYLCRTTYLLEHQSFYPQNTVPLIMNAIQSLDIDTEEDWAMAEAFIRQGLV